MFECSFQLYKPICVCQGNQHPPHTIFLLQTCSLASCCFWHWQRCGSKCLLVFQNGFTQKYFILWKTNILNLKIEDYVPLQFAWWFSGAPAVSSQFQHPFTYFYCVLPDFFHQVRKRSRFYGPTTEPQCRSENSPTKKHTMRHETHKHTQEVKHESCVKESVVGQVDRDIKVKLRVVMLVRLESILTIQMKPYKEDSTDFCIYHTRWAPILVGNGVSSP